MDQHDTPLNKEKDAQRRPIHPNFLPNQRQQQSIDVLSSTTTSSFAPTPATTITSTSNASSSSFKILDPPPPYVPPRAHSSNDVNVSNFNAITNPSSGSSFLKQRNNPEQNLEMFPPLSPSIGISPSGSATPKAVPVSGPLFSSANARAGTSASGASLRKTTSPVDDIIWTDTGGRRLRRRNGRSCPGAVNDYDDNDALRYEHATYPDGEIQDSANSDVNENHYNDVYTYTSSDNDHDHDDSDYTHLGPISTGLKNSTGETEVDEQVRRINVSSSNKQYLFGS